ncbi:MAG: hypothetical protein ABJH05_13270 [Fulvivirga sp.]
MNKLDFLIDWYHKENDRQSSINNSLSIPIGILSGLLAAFFFLSKSYEFGQETNGLLKWAFIALIIISIICWVVVVINLFLAYNNLFNGYEYKGIPYPTVLNKQHKDLTDFVDENKDQLDEGTTPDKLFDKQLIEMFSEYLNRNIANNDKKSTYLHVAKKFLLICFLFTTLSTIPFTVNYFNFKNVKKTESIEIKNIDDFKDILKDIEIENLKMRNYERQESKKADSTATTTSEIDKGRKTATATSATTKKK